MSSDCYLEASNVSKEFPSGMQRLRVLEGVSLALARGESVSIVGQSGAGKSTLLHILGALEEPTAGDVLLDGRRMFDMEDLSRSRLRNRALGFVFQFHYLLSEFSALENVSMPLRIGNRPAGDAEQAAATILDEVGLSGRLGHRPARLSGGEQQRVAVARALVHEPEFVLADEPTGNLDSANGKMVMDLLFRGLEKRGMGFIMVTHDEELAGLTEKSYLLVDGRLDRLR